MDFGLVGAAGYVAPRHLRAIKAIGGCLKVAFDLNDSVGILDSYFPSASFFTEFERFDRHVDLLRRTGKKIDYLSICSPNHLHDAHCRFALRSDIDAICEKPLVLNPWNLDGLTEIETATGRSISTILQLRLHPAIQNLKARIDAERDKEHNVDLSYIASRGRWYHTSWKGSEEKSGGVATNIGIHFFDVVRRGATIGANATVVCGNEIGCYAFVGAGAVITQRVPDYALMVGIPARRIGWMSRAGERLGPALTCSRDGSRYREKVDGSLEYIDAEP